MFFALLRWWVMVSVWVLETIFLLGLKYSTSRRRKRGRCTRSKIWRASRRNKLWTYMSRKVLLLMSGTGWQTSLQLISKLLLISWCWRSWAWLWSMKNLHWNAELSLLFLSWSWEFSLLYLTSLATESLNLRISICGCSGYWSCWTLQFGLRESSNDRSQPLEFSSVDFDFGGGSDGIGCGLGKLFGWWNIAIIYSFRLFIVNYKMINNRASSNFK